MGLFEDLLGFPKTLSGLDIEAMADYRLGRGFEPIDWKRILSPQLQDEARRRQLNSYEQLMLESLSNV